MAETMRLLEAAAPARPLPWSAVWPKLISTICPFGLAGVPLWAGLAKAADPSMAALVVRAYEIVLEVVVMPVAWRLLFVEIGIGALLVLGIGTRIAAALSLALLLGSAKAVAWAGDQGA